MLKNCQWTFLFFALAISTGFTQGPLRAGEPSELANLKQGLQNPKEATRVDAIKKAKIADAEASQAADLLAPLLADKSGQVQQAVSVALLKLGVKSVPALARVAKSQDGRKLALATLRLFGPAAKAALPMLVELTKEKDAPTRLAAVYGLESLGTEAGPAVGVVANLIRDPDAQVGAVAGLVLIKIGPASIPHLSGIFSNAGDQKHWQKVVGLLARIEPRDQPVSPEVVQALTRHLDHKEVPIRLGALQILQGFGLRGNQAAPAIARLLGDDNNTLREIAGNTLVIMGPPSGDTLATLARLLKEGSPEGRSATIRLLLRFVPAAPQGKEALDMLLAALPDGDWHTRRTIALGLAKSGNEAVAGLIEVVETGANANARAEAIFALGTLGPNGKGALKSLVESVREPNLPVRLRAITALEQIAPEVLMDLLNDRDISVRVLALDRIKREPASKAIPTLLKLLRDRDEEVRAAAGRALARIGPAAVDEVAPLLQDKEAAVRRTALQAIESHVTPAFLGKLLGDDKAEVGRAVAEALAKKEADAYPVIRDGLRSKDFRVQRNSALAIVPMLERADDLIPGLVDALLTKDPETQELAQAILRVNPVLGARELAQKAEIPALVALLKMDIPEAQILACLALRERGGPADDAVPILTGLLKNPKTDVNLLAAAARTITALQGKDSASRMAPDLVARLVQGTHEKSRQLREAVMVDQRAGWNSDSFDSILSALYVGESTDEANDWVIHHANASSTTGWSSPNMVRILGLFHSGNKRFQRRLTPTAEQALKDHCWRFLHEPTQGRGSGLQPIPLADLKAVLPIERLVWTTSAYLALGVLKDDPAYKDRKLHGKSLPDLHEEWTLWWRDWAKQRVLGGLWSEMGLASHQFHIWPCLLNMHDCASDPFLKQRIKMLLDITVIEEEQISLHGVRAGRRGKKNGVGCGIDQWKDLLYGEAPRRFGEACAGFNGIVWTTSYEMPTAAILLRKLDRPVSHYVIANHHFFNGTVFAYAAPHYILASQLSQPRGSMEFIGAWHRLVFDDMNAVFFPFYTGNRRHVQHQNVYVTRWVGGPEERQAIHFTGDLKIAEKNGWFFASNGPAYVGIHIVGGYELEKSDRKELGPQRFDSLLLKDSQATVLLHAGDTKAFGSFEKFQKAILEAPLKIGDESLHYTGPNAPAIEFFRNPDKAPLVAGVPHTYRGTTMIYDGPYLQGKVDSAQIDVRVGDYSAVYDFEKNAVMEGKTKN